MKDTYKRFKGCTQILSYRFGDSLEEPYNKFDSFKYDSDFICIQEEVSNYGYNNGIKKRTLFQVPKKKFSIKLHLEEINGSYTKS
jgi:hypothetical protein